jgi:addiction module RelE/StbE family toxin
MYSLVWTKSFAREARKFLRTHPDLRNRFDRVLQDLESDPFQPHLRLHPLQGALKGMHAVSITHSYRIVLTLQITELDIILLDVGGHDDVYR